MYYVARQPLLLFVMSFLALWLSAVVGRGIIRRRYALEEELREDFGFILGGSLTLLGLIIGFTFSMATTRYDQRKNYEEEEANAIGTEYLRAGLLPDADGAKIRAMLKTYLDLRIQFYLSQDNEEVQQINISTAQLQSNLWAAVIAPAATKQTPIVTLAVSGMNDVLNSQGYTQAAWWNRIPIAAWALMVAIAVGCNVLLGYGSRGARSGAKLLPILPIAISIAFVLISDIDSPRRGIIRLRPQNLMTLAQSLRSS